MRQWQVAKCKEIPVIEEAVRIGSVMISLYHFISY